MDAQDFRSLQEAYLEVVMNEGLGGFKNQGDYEEREREFKRVSDEHLKKYRSGELPFQKQKKADQAQEFLKKHPRKKRTQNEETDIYDIILSHLLDEGYAETQEQAEVIMVNMSEEWRESIVEGFQPVSDNAAESMRRKEASLRPGGYPGQDTTANWKRHKKLQSGMAKTGVKPI
jgi:DNA-directed RNA polymerase specialized sigma54-like protein